MGHFRESSYAYLLFKHCTILTNLSQEGLSNRINPLAKGVAPAIVLPP